MAIQDRSTATNSADPHGHAPIGNGSVEAMAEPEVRSSSSDSWNRLLVQASATILLVFLVVAWLDFHERGGRIPGPLEPGNLFSEPSLDYVEDVFAPPIFRYEHNRGSPTSSRSGTARCTGHHHRHPAQSGS